MPTHHDDDAGHPAAWGPGWPSALLGGGAAGGRVAGALGLGRRVTGAVLVAGRRRAAALSGCAVGGVLAAVLLGGLLVELRLLFALIELTLALGLDLLFPEALRLRFGQGAGARRTGQGRVTHWRYLPCV